MTGFRQKSKHKLASYALDSRTLRCYAQVQATQGGGQVEENSWKAYHFVGAGRRIVCLECDGTRIEKQ